MPFSSQKNKITSSKNKATSISVNIDKKSNELRRFLNGRTDKFQTHTLYDSGWTAHQPTQTSITRTINKGEFLPEIVNKDFDLEVTIPEELLPYIRLEKTIQPVEGTEAVMCVPFTQSYWSGNYIEVYGDTQKIFAGPKNATNMGRKTIKSQESLDAGYFDEDLTKRMYNAVIEYTNGGNLYKVEGLMYIMKFTKDTGVGCSGNPESDIYTIAIDPDISGMINYSEFLDITTTGIYGTWRKQENVWEDRGSGCQQYTTFSQTTQTIAFTFADETYGMQSARKYLWNGSQWVLQGSGNYIVDETVGDVVTSRSFLFRGYWLYYSTQRRWLFGVTDSDFDGHEDDLWSPPDTGGDPSISLPYTTITLQQNLGDEPTTYVTSKDVYSATAFETQDSYRLYKTNADGTNTYKLTSRVAATIKAPAVVQTTTSPNKFEFDVYDNEWTVSGDTYAKTTTSQTTKIKPVYQSEKANVNVRLKVVLLNPKFFQEIRNYG